jgi:F-type H+-transporting ATPase subunit delta
MSDLTTYARPYARAAWESARSASEVDEWQNGLGVLAQAVEVPEMAGALDQPGLAEAVLPDILIGVAGIESNTKLSNFVRILSKNRRLALLPEVFQQFVRFRSADDQRISASVVSAFELDDDQKTTLLESLRRRFKQDVTLECSTDPALIGGVVINAGCFTIDGSVRGRLGKLGKTLEN